MDVSEYAVYCIFGGCEDIRDFIVAVERGEWWFKLKVGYERSLVWFMEGTAGRNKLEASSKKRPFKLGEGMIREVFDLVVSSSLL